MGSYDGGNTTGFVSPASGCIEAPIDLAEILDLRGPSRDLVRVEGDALVARGVQSGDILVVDTDTRPTHGSMAIVMIKRA